MRIYPEDVLLITDIQRDFLPGGSLAVRGGEQVIAPLKRLTAVFRSAGAEVYASRDWHPVNHCSFREQGGPWPAHCLMGSSGAEFADELNWDDPSHVISKATHPEHEAYSAFDQTELHFPIEEKWDQTPVYRRAGHRVLYSEHSVGRKKLGYEVYVVEDAIRGLSPEDEFRARQEMAWEGAQFVDSQEIVENAVSELRNRRVV